MFLLKRTNLIAATGTVEEADNYRIRISGVVTLPVSKNREKRFLNIRFKNGLGKMNPKPGNTVIVTARPDISVESLMDGVETDEKEYDLAGYNVRYSGAFNFKACGEQPEENIFSGKIKKVQKTKKGWSVITLSVRTKNAYEDVFLVSFENFTPTGNEVFVTGEGTPGASGRLFYPVTKIYRPE